METKTCKKPETFQLNKPEDVLILIDDLFELDHEETWLYTFTGDNHLIASRMVSMGGFDNTYIDMRILFKRILNDNASKFFLAHNHPNQATTPSKEDIETTKTVLAIADFLNVQCIDHIVVGLCNLTSINAIINKEKDRHEKRDI